MTIPSFRTTFRRPIEQRKIQRHYTMDEVRFVIRSCTLGPNEIARKTGLTYEQVRYILIKAGCQGMSAYTRRNKQTA